MEDTQQAFEEWEADINAWGDLDQDYMAYVNEFMGNEEPMKDMLSYEQFARQKYNEFLLEVHQEDELDDEDEPCPDDN